MKTKLMILKGGNSLEREISLKSFEYVISNINTKKYDILDIDVLDVEFLIQKIKEFKPDVVLNLIHGGIGEDGTLQSLLSLFNIKYVGSKALSSGICMDKNLTKIILNGQNVPIVDYVYIKNDEDAYFYKNEIDELLYPVIVKPNRGGSSIGVTVANDIDKVFEAIKIIKNMGDDIIIEKFIDGKEAICTVIQDEKGIYVLPVLDIKLNKKIFDYDAKYTEDTSINFSKLPNFLKRMIEEVAKKSFLALKCEGYANVDFMIKDDDIYVIEVNTIPGFTKKSLLTKALSLNNISISDFLDDVIKFSCN